jgi:hypothetical protein
MGEPASVVTASQRLQVTVRHENAMLSRLATTLGLHDVDHFSYRARDDGRALVVVDVCGGEWQVQRAAARIGRVIGVLDVVVED